MGTIDTEYIDRIEFRRGTLQEWFWLTLICYEVHLNNELYMCDQSQLIRKTTKLKTADFVLKKSAELKLNIGWIRSHSCMLLWVKRVAERSCCVKFTVLLNIILKYCNPAKFVCGNSFNAFLSKMLGLLNVVLNVLNVVVILRNFTFCF